MSSMSSSLNPELQPTLPASIPRPFWKIRDPDKITGSESEAIRMAYAADEAHLKSLGWLNFVLALGFTFMTVHFMMLAVQVAKGTILAPWMNMTPWVVVIRLQPILTILAADHRIRSLYEAELVPQGRARLRSRVCRIWRVVTRARHVDGSCDGRALSCVAMLFWLLPMTILLRPGCSVVLSAEYKQVVKDHPLHPRPGKAAPRSRSSSRP